MRIFGYIALFMAAALSAVVSAHAQITLNLDVLTEDFIPKDATTSAPVPAAPEQPEKPAKPVVPATVPAKKGTDAAAQSVNRSRSDNKYHVQESRVQDAHDRLKPRAKPVPEVKLLEMRKKEAARKKALEEKASQARKAAQTAKADGRKTEDGVKTAAAGKTDAQTPKQTAVAKRKKEPSLSKLFLEQQKDIQNAKDGQTGTARIANAPAGKPPAQVRKKADAARKEPPDREKSKKRPQSVRDRAEQIAAKEEQERQKTKILPFASVIRTPENLSPEKRSNALLQKLPQESETAVAVAKNKRLASVLLFDGTSEILTPEMGTELDALAVLMHKHPEKRMTVYGYSAPTQSPDYGRERQISLRRVLAVRSYMVQAGINSLRVDIRAFGQRGAGDKIPNRADILIYER